MSTGPASLRGGWAELVADDALEPAGFGSRATALVDGHLRHTFTALVGTGAVAGTALVALGSYGRADLCPGSDLDVLLVHSGSADAGRLADGLWYPLWDAGFVLGHGVRTIREALALGDADSEALFAMLDARHLAGDRALSEALASEVRVLARQRRERLVDAIARGVDARGAAPVAELLEPDLKRGGGGLRDALVLSYASAALGGPVGTGELVARGYLRAEDADRVAAGRKALLAARVALHLVTGSRQDVLWLQEHDAVAARLGVASADDLAARVARAARDVSWIARDVCARLRSREAGPVGRLVRRDRHLGDGVVARDGRATLLADAAADGDAALRLASSAAGHGLDIDPGSLERLSGCVQGPDWSNPAALDAFTSLLLRGRESVGPIEALDHIGVFPLILPEWERLRALPQRNAYHRYTVDRHLLEAVCEAVDLLGGSGFDREVGEQLERPELLVLAALLHDAAKGLPGDHAAVGAELAVRVCTRIGLDPAGIELVGTVVRFHLLLADVATRRDLSEAATIAAVAQRLGQVQAAHLCYLLTVADSRATGPAAWGPGKAELVRELYVRVLHVLEEAAPGSERGRARGELGVLVGAEAGPYLDAMPPAYARAFDAGDMARHLACFSSELPAMWWTSAPGDLLECTVVCPDRRGLLATVAGVLALSGYDVRSAWAFTRRDGLALEVFQGVDRFGRLGDTAVRDRALETLREALEGSIDLERLVDERTLRYASRVARDVSVVFDDEASDTATVLEIHAGDTPGVLHRVAAALARADVDVQLAKVATLGDRVVDTFYVRDARGGKLTDPGARSALADLLEQAAAPPPPDVAA